MGSIGDDGSLLWNEANGAESDLGFWGQVAKTTDGGESWDIIYETIDEGYYPNDIDCYDENTCAFVMEGNYAPKIVTTQDGGATWQEFVDESGSDSLMAVRMIGPKEVWAAGGGDTGRFWHSTDFETF